MIVNHVIQVISVQVLEWRHLKNVLMEHTVTRLVLDIVFCVQRAIGEVLYPIISKSCSFDVLVKAGSLVHTQISLSYDTNSKL